MRAYRSGKQSPNPTGGSLTTSGGLITDAVRTTGAEGDGLTPPAGVGIWPAATNLVTNGGFETNTTGWSTTSPGFWLASGGSFTRVTNESKFGTASARLQVSQTNRGAAFAVTLAATTTYTVSLWYKGTGNGTQFFFGEADSGTSSFILIEESAPDWTRASVTFTTSADTACVIGLRGTQATPTVDYYIDGVQIETGPIATPYIETDGATASRAAGRAQIPVSGLFTATQGAVFSRLRMGYPSASVTTGTPYVFDYKDNANNAVSGFFDESANNWVTRRFASDVGTVATVANTFTTGDSRSVAHQWSATAVAMSLGGAAFVSAADTNIPVLVATTVDIGRQTTSAVNFLSGNVLWFATFAGTLTDADAAALDSFGDTPPTPELLMATVSRAAELTSLWACVDGTFQLVTRFEPQNTPSYKVP